jgi:spermidine synthase
MALLVLFAGSGCAALIYEIVWLQLLQLVIGSSAVSMAVLLGTFMGGMCLGSLALPRVVSRRFNPLRVYAALELATGCCGLAVFFGLPYVERLYVANATGGFTGILLRGVVSAVCLLPPTMLMGATLPAMARWVEATPQAAAWWGFFYGGNIAGGVFGCLLAGFWLLRVYDMAIASYVAVAIDVAVAAVAYASAPAKEVANPVQATSLPSHRSSAHVVIGISGLCALGAEVVWTRLLSLTFGPTVYTFSIILAVFLLGLGIGSGAGSSLARRPAHARSMLAACQFLLIPAIAWSGYMIANRLPYWDKNLSTQANPWMGFLFDLACCAIAILPAAICWGASFPFALACAASQDGDAARTAGNVYAANTAGAIIGAVLFSIVVVQAAGSQNAERLLVLLSALAAALAYPHGRQGFWRQRLPLAGALMVAAIAVAWAVPPIPWKLIAFGRRMPMEEGPWKNLYTAEGMNSSIAYSEWVDKRRFFHVSGKVEASNSPADMSLQRMLGHLPALLHANPRSVLIVGCGAGVTAGTFVAHPEVEHITLCEIEPLIPPASARFFAKENHNVMRDRRTRIVLDDARHYLLTTPEKFDIVTSDPIHPWVKGSATLYSREYFAMCRAHLNPGGLVTQWVPLYESDLATVKSEVATFVDVFPNAILWGDLDLFAQGYDLVLMGSADPIRIDVDAVEQRIDRSSTVAESLREVGIHSAAELLGTYAGRSGELRAWLAGAEINRDRSLRLQYLAGMALNSGRAGSIYSQILARSPFPENLFSGSAEQMAAMRRSFTEWRTAPF